jgi:hypothetical protein
MNEYDENEDTKFLELVNELKWSIIDELIRKSMNDFEGVSSESLSKGERIITQCLKSLKSLKSQIKRTKIKNGTGIVKELKFFTYNPINSNNMIFQK